MPEGDIIKMSVRELKKLKVVQEAVEKQITQNERDKGSGLESGK
jgi:hypothetical protein